MSRYILVFHGDESVWDAMSAEEKTTAYAAHGAFKDRLLAGGGQITGGAELWPSRTTHTVRAGSGVATEGPFAETVEQVTGFLDVEAPSLEVLLDAVVLLGENGESVEVRRVMTDDEREESL